MRWLRAGGFDRQRAQPLATRNRPLHGCIATSEHMISRVKVLGGNLQWPCP